MEEETIQWDKHPLAINRVVSNYTENPELFLTWAKKVEKTTILWNPSPVLEWNWHKGYLLELQKKGIPTPKTIMIEKDTQKPIDDILSDSPWDELIFKPCIGAGSTGIRKVNRNSSDIEQVFRSINRDGFKQSYEFTNDVYDNPPRDTLIQRYIPEIKSVGEASMFYFGGEYSHAVIKKPKAEDFRAHSIWGAEVDHYSPSERVIQVGFDALEVVGSPVEFARIDLIPLESSPYIIEVELIDPFFFFEFAAGTVDLYANHIK